MKIFITGASSGLGRQLAIEYATADNELILLARRKEKLEELQAILAPCAKSVEIIVADLCEFKTLQEKIKDLENIDLLILNAGVSLGHNHGMSSIEEFKNLYDVNLLSNHAILEILIPKMQKRERGVIVFVSSLASLFSMPTSKVYSSSKRALNAYAEGIKYKYAKDGIKVLTLLPGFIKSELTDKNDFHMPFFLSTEKGVKIMKKAIEKERVFYPFPLRFYLIIMLFKITPNFLRQMIIDSFNKNKVKIDDKDDR